LGRPNFFRVLFSTRRRRRPLPCARSLARSLARSANPFSLPFTNTKIQTNTHSVVKVQAKYGEGGKFVDLQVGGGGGNKGTRGRRRRLAGDDKATTKENNAAAALTLFLPPPPETQNPIN